MYKGFRSDSECLLCFSDQLSRERRNGCWPKLLPHVTLNKRPVVIEYSMHNNTDSSSLPTMN